MICLHLGSTSKVALLWHSKSFVNHIFAFFLAGSPLLLYLATRFPLNLFVTFFFWFSHFKESNDPVDTETFLEKEHFN